MALTERALGRLADGGEGGNEDVVERLAFGQLLAELFGACLQRLVGERCDFRFQRVKPEEGNFAFEPPNVQFATDADEPKFVRMLTEILGRTA